MIDKKRFPEMGFMPEPAFGNAEYQVKITHSVRTDKRLMSFVDVLWGFEVTGGYDQYEPLTVINVRRSGYARRAGIRVNDRIIRINDTYTDGMTLREAQLLIRKSGKQLRIYVSGDDDAECEDEFTVDFWFTPPRKRIVVENKWPVDGFPWNDRKKKIYRESNCFMVPSKAEEKIVERMLMRRDPIIVTEDTDNLVSDTAPPRLNTNAPNDVTPAELQTNEMDDSTTSTTTNNNNPSVDTIDKGR